jgi:hypothetical protein
VIGLSDGQLASVMEAAKPLPPKKRGIFVCNRRVRFTPESGHVQCTRPCPLRANSGHCPSGALQNKKATN